MSGRLGTLVTAVATNEVVGAAMTAITTLNIVVTNPTVNNAKIRLYIVNGAIGTLTPVDLICSNRVVEVDGEYEKTGLVLSVGETVVVWSDQAGVVVRVNGYTA